MGSLGNAAGIVVVFDFDKTIIDCDSDNWVVDGLGATQRFDELVHALPWNAAVWNEYIGRMRSLESSMSQGITIQDIVNRLKEVPIDQHVVEGIKSAYALGCDLRVVSDANLFFIKTVLEHHGIYGCFSEINTNPGVVDEEGRLRVSPYHDFCRSHHGCPLPSCPPNMCKGLIMERIQGEGKSRIIYLGDGKGDYCPSRKLSTKDYVMPRTEYPVWDLICSDPEAIKAEIHGWSDGKEQAEILVQLINKVVVIHGDEDAEILHGDSAYHINIPRAETLPKVPTVF